MKTLQRVSIVFCFFLLASFVYAQAEEQTITYTFSPGDTVWDIWSVSGSGPWIEFREAVRSMNPTAIARGFENIAVGANIEVPLALLDITTGRAEAASSQQIVGDMAFVPLETLNGFRETIDRNSDTIALLTSELAARDESNTNAVVPIESNGFWDPPWLLETVLGFLALLLLYLFLKASSERRGEKEVYEEDLDALRAELVEVKEERDRLLVTPVVADVGQELLGSFDVGHREDLDAQARIFQNKLAEKARNYSEIVDSLHRSYSELEEEYSELKTKYSKLQDEHRRFKVVTRRKDFALRNSLQNSEVARERIDDSLSYPSHTVSEPGRRRGTRGRGRKVKPSP